MNSHFKILLPIMIALIWFDFCYPFLEQCSCVRQNKQSHVDLLSMHLHSFGTYHLLFQAKMFFSTALESAFIIKLVASPMIWPHLWIHYCHVAAPSCHSIVFFSCIATVLSGLVFQYITQNHLQPSAAITLIIRFTTWSKWSSSQQNSSLSPKYKSCSSSPWI